MVRAEKWIVHAIAKCEDCDFTDEYYLTAVDNGRKHNKNTGHKVTVEVGFVYKYK